jgi:alkylhydroperoxidase family enzyme
MEQAVHPRLHAISDEEASPEVAEIFNGATQLLGRTANFLRTMAHSPGVAKWLLPFVVALQREGAGSVLDLATKELAIIKTSLINACAY